MAEAALKEKYGTALMDGRMIPLGNFKIEPPGLFRGRGDHPKMGMLKKRVTPNQVIINCGADSKVGWSVPGAGARESGKYLGERVDGWGRNCTVLWGECQMLCYPSHQRRQGQRNNDIDICWVRHILLWPDLSFLATGYFPHQPWFGTKCAVCCLAIINSNLAGPRQSPRSCIL